MLIRSAELKHTVYSPKVLPTDSLPQVAFAGRSNVGKSSLINALLNRKSLARTSSTPGKTRMIYFYLVNGELYFVDLPGYGYAAVARSEREQFKVLVERYLDGNDRMRATVLLLDPRRSIQEEELAFVRYLKSTGRYVLPVFTKWDKLPSSKRDSIFRQRLGEFAGLIRNTVCVSARTGEGIEQLWRILDGRLVSTSSDSPSIDQEQ